MRSGPEPGVVVTLRIEKLRRRDLRQLLRIESRVFPEPWSPEVFNSELALRKGRLYRATWDGDEMAGYIGFMIVDDEAHMTTIATAPAYQRTGVATTMIVDGIRTLRAGGVKHISLEVAANNEPAQALYRRFGFAPVGVRKNYYPVTGQDALVMWVYDIDSESYAERLDHLAATGVAVEEGRSRSGRAAAGRPRQNAAHGRPRTREPSGGGRPPPGRVQRGATRRQRARVGRERRCHGRSGRRIPRGRGGGGRRGPQARPAAGGGPGDARVQGRLGVGRRLGAGPPGRPRRRSELGLDVPETIRSVFRAAGGSHGDWAEFDRVMAEERRCAVFVRADSVSTNAGSG